jgi:hypothetical protein
MESNKNMGTATQHSPVILLLGQRTSGQNQVDEWLAASRYSACEASDVFQALEQVSDFTQRDRPDVIFLHVDSIGSNHEFLQMLVATAPDEPDIPIIDFAETPKSSADETFDKAIAGLACKLDEFIPKRDAARA